MSDYLVQLGRSGVARRMVSMLGLPLPLPQDLARDATPYRPQELKGSHYLLGGSVSSEVEALLTEEGAKGERSSGDYTGESVHGLIFDARGLHDVRQLREVYDFFHTRIRKLKRCARIVVLGDAVDSASDAKSAAISSALDGFIRSVSKEVGRKGATANVLYVGARAVGHLAAPLRFLLSDRSAFITGQPFALHAGVDVPQNVWEQPLQGQVALVTGAARGIGAATARRLAAEGAQVVCLDRPGDDALQSVVDEIKGFALPLDVTDAAAPAAITQFLTDRFGGVDVVIHNAGVTRDRTLGRMKSENWDLTLHINLQAILDIQHQLESSGCLREGGRVVCLSSIAGIAGNVGQTNYAASKAGLIGYVRHHAPELKERNVTLTAIAPGFIETRMTQAIPFMTREGARRLSNLGQGGTPEDVAELLTFLSMPGAAGLSGQVIRICGGNLVGR